MLKNHLKIALRQFRTNKVFSLINVVGLTAGTLCCLYILLYVKDQFSYDQHHSHHKDMYRVTSLITFESGDAQEHFATASPPIVPAMKIEFPEVEQFTRTVNAPGVTHHLLRYKNKSFYETSAIYADSTFFDMFDYHFLSGDASTAIREPYSVVLHETVAKKLFGSGEAVGESIEIDNSFGKRNYKITGVIDDSNGKSHIRANLYFAMNSGGIGEYVRRNDVWAGNNFISAYVRLKKGTDPKTLETKLPAFLVRHGGEQLKATGMHKVLNLQPVSEIHTSTGLTAESSKTVSGKFLYVLLLIGGMLQLIACINFMNLATARSSKRAREVGVRKVIGAVRWQLVRQFMTESTLLSFIAVSLSIPFLYMLVPVLNNVTSGDVDVTALAEPGVWSMIILLVLATGLIAGSYPAFYLSNFKILDVIKGKLTKQGSVLNLRKALVVFQFMLSVVLIISILIINKQLHYVNNKDLGYEQSQRLVFSFRTNEAREKQEIIQKELGMLAEVNNLARTNNYPSQFVYNDMGMYQEGGNAATAKNVKFMLTADKLATTLGIRIKAGRDLQRNDSGRIVVNETLLREMNIAEEQAVGSRIYSRDNSGNADLSLEIVGVMSDFHFNSLHEKIEPFMLIYSRETSNLTHLVVSSQAANYSSYLSRISTIWQKHLPGVPFEYTFLDEEVQKQYKSEQTLSNIINVFTLIAILISCLGLLGLSAFTAEQRKKEIGIRKVLGASVAGIVTMLSKEFVALVLVSIAIAAPIAWWTMNQWLQDFQYRIDISVGIMLLAAGIAILIAIITVSVQALRAALSNPVNSIKSE